MQCSSSLSLDHPSPVKFNRLHRSTGGLEQQIVAIAKPQSTIQHLLQDPSTPFQLPQNTTEKNTSRVLISLENISLLAEKKEEAAQLKEAKRNRERKRHLKQSAISKSTVWPERNGTKVVPTMFYISDFTV